MNENASQIDSVLVKVSAPGTAQRRILGRYLGERQVEFAAALGAKQVILIGGGTPEAVATRHRAEELGLKLREISGPHALVAVVQDRERLLVLQENLLPSRSAFQPWQAPAGCVQVLPAGAGAEAGFERIDLARAWSGALVVEGRFLHALLELPEDAETAPAILRIALQARVPEVQVPEQALADGSWTLVDSGSNYALVEEKWLTRLMMPAADAPFSRLVVGKVLQNAASRIAGDAKWISGLLALGVLLCAGGVALAWSEMGGWAFLAIALSVLAFETSLGLKRLASMPFDPGKYWQKLPWIVDLAMLASGMLSIGTARPEHAFAPLMLLALLHISRGKHTGWLGRLRDRALIAALVAAGGFLGNIELAIMACALLLAIFSLLPGRGDRR